jgi:hypothetical protein
MFCNQEMQGSNLIAEVKNGTVLHSPISLHGVVTDQ